MSRSTSIYSITDYMRDYASSDFVIGKDKFENLQINEVEQIKDFHFFKDASKPSTRYVKRFILKQGPQSMKVCVITLIKNAEGKFEPRFDFQTLDLTKKALGSLSEPIVVSETRLIKARINVDDCHDAFSQLLSFLQDCGDIELRGGQYSVVTHDQKEVLDKAIQSSAKADIIQVFADKYGNGLSERDINLLAKRRNALARFKKLLEDTEYFTRFMAWLKENGKSSRPEDVWQYFFENNTWIFGYGLQLVACETLDDHKLETIVVGSDLLDGAGKRIDGLLKTKGAINRSLFTEMKLHTAPLLEKYERSAVWVPGKDLRGAVAQIQKTLHKVNLKVSENIHTIRDKEGNPTGETIAFVKPNGIVLVGELGQFSTPSGINDEMFASFELYRQQLSGVEIITYDELYERARFIVEDL